MEIIGQKALAVTVLLLFALSLKVTLGRLNQQWVQTFTHTATFFLLPLTTLFVTTAISGNIALSLGMVGALSIVRFRHPVRSPLELTIYFILISAGIIGSVSINYLILFSFIIWGMVAAMLFARAVAGRFAGIDLFSVSFIEHSHKSTLTVESPEVIPTLADHPTLLSFAVGDTITYGLAADDPQLLKSLAMELQKNYDGIVIAWSR